MPSFVKVNNSGSDVDAPNAMIDEKKRKRMISNRESARRSRMKRQKHVEDLVSERSTLEKKLFEDNQKYIRLCQNHLVLESENKVLRAEKMRLAENLKYLHQIILNHEVTEADPNLVVSDRFLNPWQVYGPAKPITASGMLKF